MSPNEKLTIVMAGMIAGDPHQGGATWAVLQYLLGFKRLGHDVYFIEPISASPLPSSGVDTAISVNIRYFQQVMQTFGLSENSALLIGGTRRTVGLSYDQLTALAGRADLLINVSGMLTDEALTSPIATRVYLDLDPAFVQLWYVIEGIDMHFAGHTHFVTVGLGLNGEECAVPTAGLPWITTLQPIVLAHWPVADHTVYDAFTTIGNWRGYGSINFNGVLFGQKAHSLRPFLSLPSLTEEKFVLALAIHPAERSDLKALTTNGWCLIDPAIVAGTPGDYQKFVQGSKAEFGIAKSGYVVSQCGWFSDRSVCYLASGRPVIAQETGFSRFLPTGQGLFAFTQEEDILRGIDLINSDYDLHARAARNLAETYFDSDIVLRRLLDTLGAAA
jgi:hypothetical protein